MKKWNRGGGSQPLSRRRAAKELPALFQSPSRPFCENKGTDACAREGKGRGAAALNSKFGTNNADPCFVSPWEINASASGGLIAPYTPNSNNIYLRRGVAWLGTTRHGTARHGHPGVSWERQMRLVSTYARPIVPRHAKSAAFHRSIGSPGASRRTPHTRPLVLFIACETLRWRARTCYAAIVKL